MCIRDRTYSIPLVAADTETYPDALELCRIGDVFDTIERRDGAWGAVSYTHLYEMVDATTVEDGALSVTDKQSWADLDELHDHTDGRTTAGKWATCCLLYTSRCV